VFVSLTGNISKTASKCKRETFQHQEVNHVTGYDGLQFTVSLWGLDKEDGSSHDKVSIEQKEFLPFPDMNFTGMINMNWLLMYFISQVSRSNT
jgi:hypothetical protein